MKSKTLFFLILSLVTMSGDAFCQKAPFQDLPEEVQSNLYYFLSVDHYEVKNKKMSDQATITVSLMSDQISVMTDRPYRRTETTSVDNFLLYINRKDKKDLNLTLMVHDQYERYLPLSFEQTDAQYDPHRRTLTFKVTLIDSTAVRELMKETKETLLKGEYTTLMAEG